MKAVFKINPILLYQSSGYLYLRNANSARLLATMKPSGNEVAHGHGKGIADSMRSASYTSDILKVVKQYSNKLSSRNTVQAFRSIFTLQKHESTDMSNMEVIRTQEFQILCHNLKCQARALDLDEIIDALKALSYLGVPASSKIVQILLTLITNQINDLSHQQIIFLDFLIRDFEVCPVVDTLRVALPFVFEAQVKTNPEVENVFYLAESFRYSCKKNLSVSVNNFFIQRLLELSNDIGFKNAKSIVWSLCDLRLSDSCHMPLLHKVLDIIVHNIDKCTFIDIDTLLSKLINKYSHKNFYFYHEGFLEAATNFAVEKKCSFEEGVWILKKASKFNYVNLKLLEYLSKKIERYPHTLDSCGTVILFSFVGGLALADYRPSNWNIVELVLLRNVYAYLNQVELPWVKFARDLCTLDSWSFELFNTIFSPDFLNKYLARDYNTLDYIQLLSLHQVVCSLCPWYNGPKLPQSILEKALELNGSNVHEFPLSPSLVVGLGGESYFLTGVYTKIGHFIDHLIFLRKDFTIAKAPEINRHNETDKVYIEDLPMPEDCKMIAILFLSPSSYCANTNRLKGPHRLGIRTIEMVGPTVLPVSSITWSKLLDHEKVPYLIQEIKNCYNYHYKNIGGF